jgi:hypothetical protein
MRVFGEQLTSVDIEKEEGDFEKFYGDFTDLLCRSGRNAQIKK